MPDLSEVVDHPGGNPDIVLCSTETVAADVIRLHDAKRYARAPIPIIAASPCKRPAHAFEPGLGSDRDVHPVLHLPEQAVNEELRFIAAPGVLRPDHIRERAELRTVVAAEVDSGAKFQLQVKGPGGVPAIQVRFIRETEGGAVEPQIGISSKDFPAGSHASLRGGKLRRQNDEQ